MQTRFTYFSHCTDAELVALWSHARKQLPNDVPLSMLSRAIDCISQSTINKINHGLISWDDIITRPKKLPAETLSVLA